MEEMASWCCHSICSVFGKIISWNEGGGSLTNFNRTGTFFRYYELYKTQMLHLLDLSFSRFTTTYTFVLRMQIPNQNGVLFKKMNIQRLIVFSDFWISVVICFLIQKEYNLVDLLFLDKINYEFHFIFVTTV